MHGRWRLRAAAALTVALGLATVPLAVAAPAEALEACTTRTLSQPFKSWGDSNYYFPATSGTFEAGTTAWSLGSGVSRVAENEPWKVAGSGSYSLKIPSGSSVSTPTMCVNVDEDSVRFFYKAPSAGASLSVTVWATNSATSILAGTGFSLTSTGAGWQVSPRISLPDARGQDGTENVTIQLGASGGAWQIDDLFVDPSRTR
jgi:hypothetical protein